MFSFFPLDLKSDYTGKWTRITGQKQYPWNSSTNCVSPESIERVWREHKQNYSTPLFPTR